MEEEEETRGKNKLEIDGKKVPKREILFSSLCTLTYSTTNIGKNPKIKSEDQIFFPSPSHHAV